MYWKTAHHINPSLKSIGNLVKREKSRQPLVIRPKPRNNEHDRKTAHRSLFALLVLPVEINMPPVETNRVYMRRLSAKHRNLVLRKTQKDVNREKAPREKRRELTAEQRAELRKRFKDRKATNDEKFADAYNKVMDEATKVAGEVGKSPQSCLRILMQLARIEMSSRKTSLWNAYVAICYDERKKGQLETRLGVWLTEKYLIVLYLLQAARNGQASTTKTSWPSLPQSGQHCLLKRRRRSRDLGLRRSKKIVRRDSLVPITAK